jgi:RHS repeat-associated protein
VVNNCLQDANFNVTAVVNASGTVLERYHYTPYGEVSFLTSSFSLLTSSLISNHHLFTGRERDPETGLQLNRHRYYAAHLGRWVNRDPIRYRGGMNLCWYVAGMVARFVDPSGLGWIHWPPAVPDPPPPDPIVEPTPLPIDIPPIIIPPGGLIDPFPPPDPMPPIFPDLPSPIFEVTPLNLACDDLSQPPPNLRPP